MNEQTLEAQVKVKSQEMISALNSLINKLTSVETRVGSIEKTLNNGTIKTTITNIKQLNTATDEASISANKLKTALSLGGSFIAFKKLSNFVNNAISESIDYTEQLNLFNVTFNNIKKDGVQLFSELGAAATRFQYKLNEAFGTSKTETLYMHGIFQGMGEAVGIADNYSAIMSETMTKLTYDLASLYNKSESTTAEALRAGVYAAQTKPLRSYGIDVTQTSLQPILVDLGITDRSLKNMSQAEKEILRYLATLRQAKNAMGDFANTIESPANQLKVFKQQLVETKVAVSSLFIGIYSDILPYANAFLMVVKEISKAIASIFNIELTDYNSGIASYPDMFEDTEENANNANKAIAKLKKQTFGWDEIHNITENSSSGSNIDSFGVDSRLLDAIIGYDNGMDKVRMKAAEIRDKWMEILGFKKEIDPLTGEINFKYLGIENTIAGIIKGFSSLSTVGKLLMGIGLIGFSTNLLKVGNKIYKLIGGSGITKVLKNIISPTKSFVSLIGEATIKGGTLSKTIQEASKLLNFSEALGVIGFGITGLGISLDIMSSSTKNAAENGWNLSNSLSSVGSEVGAIASGALIGSVFGPLGAAIGAAAGGVVGLVDGLITYGITVEEIKKYNEFFDEQGVSIQNVSDKMSVLIESVGNVGEGLNVYKEAYENSKVAVDNAKESLRLFVGELDLQDEAISKAQINTLETKYNDVKSATHDAYEASREYTSQLITAYSNTTEESKKAAASQIADIKALSLAQEGYELEYIERLKELTVKQYNGELSASAYKDEVHKLDIAFGKVADDTLPNLDYAISNFGNALKDINWESPDKAKESIKSVQEQFNLTTAELESKKENVNNYFDGLIKEQQTIVDNFEKMQLTNPLTEDQLAQLETAKKLLSNYSTAKKDAINSIDSAIETITGNYKGYLSRLYTDLVVSGNDTSSKFKEVTNLITTDLNKLKKIDMTGFGKDLFDGMIKDVIQNEPQLLSTLAEKFEKYGINAGTEFANSLNDSLNNTYFKNATHATMNDFGYYAASGHKEGVYKYLYKYGAGGKEISDSIVEDTKKCMKINSPSKVMEELGIFTAEGYKKGIVSQEESIIKSIKSMLSRIEKEFSKVNFKIQISSNIESSFNSILQKLQSFTDKFRTGINSMLNGMKTSLNNIKIDAKGNVTYTAMPKITIPKFANGGFPEDGLFFANHNELVGKFNNGNTAVANNLQIEAGIEEAAYRGYLRAMNASGINNSKSIEFYAHLDEGIVIDKINQKTKQTGICPIDIPIN